MVNVRALPSDLARLVLDYLYSEGLQETYDVFLQESPHLEELRSFPAMGILPLGAKSLQVIVEEYYELMSQDTSKVKNANDALYKLWKRFDALLVQIKHHYKGSGAITTLSNELASQSVRSRYSLNRLHHERMQMERENALRLVNSSGLVQQLHQHHQPQHQPQHQQQQQTHHQPKHVQRHRQNSPFRRPQPHNIEPDTRPLMVPSPSFPTNQESRERSCDTRCSTPRLRSPMVQEALSTSPSQSVTSTQSQFVTPTKSSQHDRPEGEEKIGKSPKRKSALPRRKPHPGVPRERVISSAPSTSAGVTPIDEIQDLPSPWGSLCNNQELMEKLAENINKVRPTQEIPGQEEPADHPEAPDQANLSTETEESQQSGSNIQVLDELLNGMVSDSMMEEFVDMTSGDPTFNSLFALFNTDRDKFLNSERQKLQLSASEVEEHLNSSRESEVDSSEQQASLLPPSHTSQHQPQQSILTSSPQASTVTIISQGRNRDIQVMGSSTGHSSEVIGMSSTNQDRIFLSEELEGLSRGRDSFPNMVVRNSPFREEAACSSTALSRVNSAKKNASTNEGRSSKVKSSGMTLGSLADLFPKGHVRELSFLKDLSPVKGHQDKSHETGAAASTSQVTPSRRKATRKGSQSPRMQHNNEITPSKRPIARTPERLYSPEEKAVARLLTKLPTTPTKENAVASKQSVVIDGKKVVIVKRARTGGTSRHPPVTSVSGFQKERINIEQRVIPAVDQVNGVRSSDLPGHSRTGQSPHSIGGVKTVSLASQPHESEGIQPKGLVEGGKTVAFKEVPQDKGTKAVKKGVKRDRKDPDKAKGVKKTKRSKSKNSKDLGFPVNLDVDKFLSQINYTS
ncbi:uncharacterized protein LOC582916 [Strongylocentrotus purpuratus]|uniref:LisH domain-containing protein n=1 Tax=Strongylocentrotus purpuratus TaxID=7668 RepID=A0A7M7RCB4_STRPU|nr:uncharacterized protein LOC582916 [Strongylocentrotus purpuratus]